MIYKIQRFIGWALYKLGYKPSLSHSIADTITAGYGRLDDNGFWQYPAPDNFWMVYHGYVQHSRGSKT